MAAERRRGWTGAARLGQRGELHVLSWGVAAEVETRVRECEARRGEGEGDGGGEGLLLTHRAGEPEGDAWLLSLTGGGEMGGVGGLASR